MITAHMEDVHSWWPVVPGDYLRQDGTPLTASDLGVLRSVSMLFTLPARDHRKVAPYNLSTICLRLVSLGDEVAVVRVSVAGMPDTDVSLKVIGPDHIGDIPDNVAVATGSLDLTGVTPLPELDCGCCAFRQMVGSLDLFGGTGIVSGNNVEVSASGGQIIVRGDAGLGTGAVRPASVGRRTGLRSINGQTGDISIIGAGAIDVLTSQTATGAVLTLRPRRASGG